MSEDGFMRTPRRLLILLFCIAACMGLRAVAPAEAAVPERPSFTQTGIASWYGQERKGRRTASGERFDTRAMTAAHRKLPFGTIARVTRLDTGRTVKVRINDRGPHVRNRIVDLSSAAKAALGMRGNRVTRVRLQVFASDQARR
jgi:rare lipoprotein A